MTDDRQPVDLGPIFFPYAEERTAEAIASGGRFVYYTTAETAYRILTKQEIWLRNSTLMNDFSEVTHGLRSLMTVYNGIARERLNRALEPIFPGLLAEVEAMFNNALPQIHLDTYLFCVSEHRADEDLHGRLSMWRAYGASTGVALVINGSVMFRTSEAIGASSSPVYYGTQNDFATEFLRTVDGIEAQQGLLKGVDRERVRNTVFNMLRFAAVCTKHPGFKEELEWRVIASPSIYGERRLSAELEVIRGVPQRVLKIKLENAPDEGLTGLALPELLERIIIGPSDHPQVTGMALYECLENAGIANPGQRIVISDIPLRHRQ